MEPLLWDTSIQRTLTLKGHQSLYLLPLLKGHLYSGVLLLLVPRREGEGTSRGGPRAKKVVSDSPGLVDFAIGLVNSVFNLPDGQVMFF